ncbi:hypothetical protein GCM10011579_095810 [Streptomyces albiflavescens]|uniref:Uncharacterized protein n=1 Tax=Streptomyces albiflavescens TaxID=1623582 RepID=A0A918DAH3_9ACTN|nr:hypothetical protein [Streptomyces albiflavescens]GGN95344.1 hypothetical protein GCM10011579_095810 [Streptomyces albiflavescens]
MSRISLSVRSRALFLSAIVAVLLAISGNGHAHALVHATSDAMPLPQATSWDVRSWRWLPWQTGDTAHATIPLNETCPVGTQLMDASTYVSTGRDTAEVEAEPCTGTAAVVLRITSLDTVGSYTGSVDLSSKPGGKVKLTVRHSDAWLWPTVVVTVGVLTSLMIRRWGVRSTLRACLHELARARNELDSVTQALPKAGAEPPYRIGTSVHSRLTALRGRVIGVATAHPLSLAETAPDYVGVKQEINNVVGAIDAWRSVPEALRSVRQDLERLNSDSIPSPHPALGRQPAFLDSLASILAGKEIEADDLKTRADDIFAAQNVASRWWELNERAMQLSQQYRELESEQHSQAQTGFAPTAGFSPLDSFWLSFSSAVNQLWRRKDFREILPDGIAALLDAAAAKMDEVSLPKEAERQLLPDAGGLYGGPQLGGEAGAPLPQFLTTLSPFTRPLWTRPRFGQFGDALIILILASGAIWAGLATLYFGKTFGGVVDYVTLGLWGLGVQAAIDILAGAIDRTAAVRATSAPLPVATSRPPIGW